MVADLPGGGGGEEKSGATQIWRLKTERWRKAKACGVSENGHTTETEKQTTTIRRRGREDGWLVKKLVSQMRHKLLRGQNPADQTTKPRRWRERQTSRFVRKRTNLLSATATPDDDEPDAPRPDGDHLAGKLL